MSSYVIAATEALAAASADMSGIGEAIREATAAAGPSTTSIVPPALDEVSAAVTRLFGTYGHDFQSMSAQTAQFHSRFVQLLSSGGNAYAGAEAANASPLQALEQSAQSLAIFSPVKDITGRPLFGNGANGGAGTGANGGDGGWIIGNGGNGGSGASGGASGGAGGAGGKAGLWGHGGNGGAGGDATGANGTGGAGGAGGANG